MKKIIVAILFTLVASQAQAAVLCQSLSDPGYRAWFEGWQCPTGFYMIRTR